MIYVEMSSSRQFKNRRTVSRDPEEVDREMDLTREGYRSTNPEAGTLIF